MSNDKAEALGDAVKYRVDGEAFTEWLPVEEIVWGDPFLVIVKVTFEARHFLGVVKRELLTRLVPAIFSPKGEFWVNRRDIVCVVEDVDEDAEKPDTETDVEAGGA